MQYNITTSELEILNTLWDAGGALSREKIVNYHLQKTWKDSSVHILLNGLMKKGYVQEAGFERCGKTFGRTYAPTLTAEEYYMSKLDALPENVRKRVIQAITARER